MSLFKGRASISSGRIFFSGFVLLVLIAGSLAAFVTQTPNPPAVSEELLVKFAAGTSLSRIEELSKIIGSEVLERMAVGNPDLYRVTMPANITVDEAIKRYTQNADVI